MNQKDVNLLLTKFKEAKESALKFGETFLIEPKSDKESREFFKASYPQKFILESQARDTWVCVHRRAGKAQDLDSQILTPEGWKSMGDIKVGQLVIGADGKPAPVTKIIPQGECDIYELTFENGSTVRGTLDHSWRITLIKDGNDKDYIATTGEIQKLIAKDVPVYIKPPKSYQGVHQNLPIDPYLYGVNLIVQKYWKDFKHLREILKILRGRGIEIPEESKTLGKYLWEVRQKLPFDFDSIPQRYLNATLTDRIELLQGILDVGGIIRTQSSKTINIQNIDGQMFVDIKYLVESLGGTIKKGDRFTRIFLPKNVPPFKLPRKNKVYNLPVKTKLWEKVTDVKLVDRKDAQCITIRNSDHLYVTDNFKVTHNCVDSNAQVINCSNLCPTALRDMADAKEALGFDFETNTVKWFSCEWVESGTKQCLSFRTYSGEELVVSTDHEIYTQSSGWVKAERVQVGDKLLFPTSIPVFGKEVADQEWAKFLAGAIEIGDIPLSVFSLDEPSLKLYLYEVFKLVGRIFNSDRVVLFSFTSKVVAQKFKHLFLRLGIHTVIDQSGRLHIEDYLDVSLFLRMIGIDVLITETKPSRSWDTIESIKSVGTRKVYDLVIQDPNHNFLANNLVVHNSYSFSIIALWRALTNDNHSVDIFAQSSKQIDELFDNFRNWFAANPHLAVLKSKTGNTKDPPKITFINGSTINGHVMGQGKDSSDKIRGITSDTIIIDEAQLLDEGDWKVLQGIMKGDVYRRKKNIIRVYIAGTTEKPENYYYKKLYKEKFDDDELKIFIPIDENPEFSPEEVEKMKRTTPERMWMTEYMLQLSVGERSVFKKEDIEAAMAFNYEYGEHLIQPNCARFIGVDWDKSSEAGTNIVVCQYNPVLKHVSIIYRYEVPRSEFSYSRSVDLIIELISRFSPELVVCDAGHGENQWEVIVQKVDATMPEFSGRIHMVHFNQNIETGFSDPVTGEPNKVQAKNFLVSRLQAKFEDRKFNFSGLDEQLYNQLLAYEVIGETVRGNKYSNKDEHIIDCCSFCMYGIWELYEAANITDPKENQAAIMPREVLNYTPKEDMENMFWGQLSGRTDYTGFNVPRSSIFSWEKPQEYDEWSRD